MRKLIFLLSTGLFALSVAFFPKSERIISNAYDKEYYIGGMTAGFSLSAGGTEIIGLTEIITENGVFRPAEEVGLQVGDLIVAVDGIEIKSIQDLNDALDRCKGKAVQLTVKRRGDHATITVQPQKDKKNGKYKIGVLIRDTLSGIGTVTYIQKNTLQFGALGHPVCDSDKNLLEISNTKIYPCSIVAVNKGMRGKAGELRGLFLNDKPLAKANKVCETGLYGTFDKKYDFSNCESVNVAPLNEAKIGKAIIYSTVDGLIPQKYEINIVKVDERNKENKNFVIKISDDRLIEETGGIVQGMSGSPIIQEGKLIGAVTHVFLNDPTRGYGIGIEKMLNE